VAKELMDQAEAFFSQGKLDEALESYQKALILDPKLYEAALFSGDVFLHREDWVQAEVWYQKAIAINPNREIAYRYSATPFMKQHKYEQARDRYIEAFITEPYSKFARAGILQWSEVTKTKIGHPKIDIPSNVKFDEKSNTNINLDVRMLMGGKEDGSFAWIGYGATRAAWHKDKFAKTFPAEKTYRHSLNEEVDALQTVVHIATSDNKVKNLSPSLAKLKELNDKGLLEAYVLMVRPDDGIAVDFPSYLAQHRDKLLQYVVEYVITNGGQ
jgi:tetratricopeptide (TPR) repeat protein